MSLSPPPYNVILISPEFHFFEKSIDIYLLWKYENQGAGSCEMPADGSSRGVGRVADLTRGIWRKKIRQPIKCPYVEPLLIKVEFE